MCTGPPGAALWVTQPTRNRTTPGAATVGAGEQSAASGMTVHCVIGVACASANHIPASVTRRWSTPWK